MLKTVRTVIVDEIHAVAGNKRGAHLSLSLERLEALVEGPLQRIGLSATQRPVEEIAHLLVGTGRDCSIVDIGHRRDLDLEIEIPDSPLATVCSHETWEEIVGKMATLIQAHRTTLVFVNTRKLAERMAARLSTVLGEDKVTSHHGSLARERRLDAEQRLKAGTLRALVATASLELGAFGFNLDTKGPGVLVETLPPDYKGELQLKDRIVTIGGRAIANARDYVDFMNQEKRERPVGVMVDRGRERIRLQSVIRLPEHPEPLTARIQAEQGMLANESTKLAVLYQAAQAQEWARQQSAREQVVAGIGNLRTLPPLRLP